MPPVCPPPFHHPNRRPPPNVTLVEGNGTLIERVSLKHSNIAGLLVIGSDVTVREVLLEDLDWVGSLDFPPLQVGFGRMVCPKHAVNFDPSTCGHMLQQGEHQRTQPRMGITTNSTATAASADMGTASTSDVGAATPTAASCPVWGDAPARLRHPEGVGAAISHVTINGAGGCGIVTSQLSNEISMCKVSHAAQVGLDQAGIHADNLDAHESDLCDAHNCTKAWHHNWVYNVRDKCVRGDDGSVNMAVHHNVIFNCGGKQPRALGVSMATSRPLFFFLFFRSLLFSAFCLLLFW